MLATVLVCPAIVTAAPIVRRLNPSSGQVGHLVVLEGSDLAGFDLQVKFGRAQALVLHDPGRSEGIVRLLVPNKVDPRDPDTVTVTLLVDGIDAITPAAPLQFTYSIPQPQPVITDLTTADPLRPRSVLPNQPFVLTLSGSNFLTARRVPQRCIALGGEVRESADVVGPASDTSVGFSFPGLQAAGDYEFLIAFSDGTGASIAAPHFVEPRPLFGFPPTIQSVFFESNLQQAVQCDFTSVVELYLCSLGVYGAKADPGVFVGGTYTQARLRARVTDPDSTPTQNNILLVTASYPDPKDNNEISLVLFDDGSANTFLFPQKADSLGEDCTVDPFGNCACSLARYPINSNDPTTGDAEYTRGLAFVDPAASLFLQDCIMRQNHQVPISVAPESSLHFRIEAVDRQGNLTSWPVLLTTTVAPTISACTGDECGCCLLLSPNPTVDCQGKLGMPSTDFPDGICLSVF
jgi:hypothetical protein